jgi:hypothetical protein
MDVTGRIEDMASGNVEAEIQLEIEILVAGQVDRHGGRGGGPKVRRAAGGVLPRVE